MFYSAVGGAIEDTHTWKTDKWKWKSILEEFAWQSCQVTNQLRIDDVCVTVENPNINVHNVSDSISRILKPNEGNSSDLLEPHIPQRFTLNSLHLPTHTATWSNLPISPPSGSSLHRRKDSIWIQFIQAASSQTKDRLLRNTAVYRAFCTNITQFVPELPSSYGTSFWFGFFCCCFF